MAQPKYLILKIKVELSPRGSINSHQQHQDNLRAEQKLEAVLRKQANIGLTGMRSRGHNAGHRTLIIVLIFIVTLRGRSSYPYIHEKTKVKLPGQGKISSLLSRSATTHFTRPQSPPLHLVSQIKH